MYYPSAHQDRTHPYPAVIQPGWLESSDLPSTEHYNRILFRARVSRLVNVFPEELVIQEKTVSVIHHDTFAWYVETIPITDIQHIKRVGTWIFAGLDIVGNDEYHDMRVWGLRKPVTDLALELIEGLLLERVGITKVPKDISATERTRQLIRYSRYTNR